jgi:hypothetical protein
MVNRSTRSWDRGDWWCRMTIDRRWVRNVIAIDVEKPPAGRAGRHCNGVSADSAGWSGAR